MVKARASAWASSIELLSIRETASFMPRTAASWKSGESAALWKRSSFATITSSLRASNILRICGLYSPKIVRSISRTRSISSRSPGGSDPSSLASCALTATNWRVGLCPSALRSASAPVSVPFVLISDPAIMAPFAPFPGCPSASVHTSYVRVVTLLCHGHRPCWPSQAQSP